ncbi:hypothetical protein ACFV2H_38840 [Streptomyces sp. NPDC059629]|uniref:hypothetical protein n=1 Tax=Streptomyces sp. NPDC059629 TaxID=3346889 RepID=UPI0036B0291B
MSAASEAADLVLHERHDGALTITINRPAQKNAMDHEAALQLAAAVDLLDAEELSVGVLEPLTAAEGKDYGLVNVLTPPGGALDGALELAGRGASRGTHRWRWRPSRRSCVKRRA